MDDGKEVASGGEIAIGVDSKAALDSASRARELKKEIAYVSSLLSRAGSASGASDRDSDVRSAILQLNAAVSAGSTSELDDLCMDLRRKYPGIVIVGSGGNINKLYKLVGCKRGQPMAVTDLEAIYNDLLPLSVEERMVRYSLRPDRADVIIPAGKIFLTIAALTGARQILVPVIGVADGIIDGLLKTFCKPK